MKKLESFLNGVTMYRLVLYALIGIAASGFVAAAFGLVGASASGLAISLAILLPACWLANRLFSYLFDAPANVESVWITALILFLTLAPPATLAEGIVIAVAGALAIGSKFYLAIRRKHLFNPAAVALLILSLAGSGLASWWVGAPVLLLPVAVAGFLIVRKIRRFDVVWPFLLASLGTALLFVLFAGASLGATLSGLVLSGPLVFFAAIMLTEPLTMPPTKPLRIVFGLLIGALYASQFHIGSVFMTPQLALVAGNLYAFMVGARQRATLRLQAIERLSANVYEFVFVPSRKLAFVAGQYLEWTLPHKSADNRGNRRFFTIASAPEENEVRLGVRIDARRSSYKEALLKLQPGDSITAIGLAGDFVLPRNTGRKLAFIAGGVGITPFMSMIRHLRASGERRDIVLFYAASSEADLAYRPLLEAAKDELNLRVVYAGGRRITPRVIADAAPDYLDRLFYISGPDAMVRAYKQALGDMGISRRSIKTDYFSGFGGAATKASSIARSSPLRTAAGSSLRGSVTPG